MRNVVLRVSPTGTRETEGLALVIFDELGDVAELGDPPPDAATPPPHDADAAREIEAELDMTRGRLQALVEEFETSQEEMRASNEELQSANEELRSTMEELETSREELQSINEELQTVNQENRHKVEELSQLSSDLQNLLKVTDIATLFLDRSLRINRATPRVAELFNIRHSDRGRPLADLTHRLGYDGLLDDAREVLDTLVPVEREVQVENGHWFLIRVVPYRTLEDRIEGVVITLVDVTPLKRSEAALRESESRFRTVVDLVPDLLWQSAPDGTMHWYNARWYEYTGQTAEEAAGWGWLQAIHPDDRGRAQGFTDTAERGEPFVQELRIRAADGSHRWFLVRAVAQRDERGAIARWFGTATDIHTQRLALDEVESRVAERTAERDALRRAFSVAEESERRRLGRELHDEAGQHLTALGLGLQALSDVASAGSEVDRRAADLRSLVNALARELHSIAVGLRPRALDDFGLEAALTVYAEEWSRRSGIAIDVHATVDGERLPEAVESALYRIVQEALTNVARHSGATRAGVVVERRDGHVVVVVEDDGRGFDAGNGADTHDPSSNGGLGLLGIRERAALLGGRVEVESTAEGRGATLFVHIPVDTPSATKDAAAAPHDAAEDRTDG
jgi:two-component system CheB/CheR fusion protein